MAFHLGYLANLADGWTLRKWNTLVSSQCSHVTMIEYAVPSEELIFRGEAPGDWRKPRRQWFAGGHRGCLAEEEQEEFPRGARQSLEDLAW